MHYSASGGRPIIVEWRETQHSAASLVRSRNGRALKRHEKEKTSFIANDSAFYFFIRLHAFHDLPLPRLQTAGPPTPARMTIGRAYNNSTVVTGTGRGCERTAGGGRPERAPSSRQQTDPYCSASIRGRRPRRGRWRWRDAPLRSGRRLRAPRRPARYKSDADARHQSWNATRDPVVACERRFEGADRDKSKKCSGRDGSW
ncbi:hypothetical protein EVAR_35_1 [Eumeta japonica]|uniref:Uncharacterized protein n=1 Tax=Eumeta variegata TaxID=151549 RepID=A0A4C1SBB0_EUMVA|nr:hypothetical protein EVAR_35_1 [Eumeta japonica]